jgi:hypothetical protein
MRHLWAVVLGTMGLVATGCGGGTSMNGGGVTPPPPVNTTMSDLVASDTFPTASASLSGQLSTIGQPSNLQGNQSNVTAYVVLEYDKPSNTYTVTVTDVGVNESVAFAPNTLDASSSVPGYSVYSKTSSSTEYTFSWLVPGAAGSGLTYVTFGAWAKDVTTASGEDFATSVFVAGIRTPVNGGPQSGTATYQTIAGGVLAEPSGISGLAGSGSLTADFSANTIQGQFDLTKVDVDSNESPFESFTANGTLISGNFIFSGQMSGQSTAYSGDWAGSFYGPNAEEIGGSFRVTNGSSQAIGAFVGSR